jgi:hypothetical protein
VHRKPRVGRPEIGEFIYYRTFGMSMRYVKVTDVQRMSKNGKAGFDCVDLQGNTDIGVTMSKSSTFQSIQ